MKMKIKLKEISIRDVVEDYLDDEEEGVSGYGGELNIRPKYQREFVYDAIKRDEVIKTVKRGFPLNIMYWATNKDGTFELLDGQQRTISLCEYISNNFSVFLDGHHKTFDNLTDEERNKILDYKLMIYICEGEEKEKLDWFKIVNIAGVELTRQELRNAVYTGKWLSDAKRYFSKTGCPAYNIAKNYIKGSPIRQEFLETALDWISNKDIENYMSKNQKKANAKELWKYFNSVIEWVEKIFTNHRKQMKGVDWGLLYNQFKDQIFEASKVEAEVKKLMMDEDVQKKSGIYYYIFDRKEKHLNVRSFSDNQKREIFEKQNGICLKCSKTFVLSNMEADHINPWHSDGKTISENCQMLCKPCNRKKSGK